MEIKKQKDGKNLTLAVDGRLDTTTAPELDQEVQNSLGGVETLVMDLEGLEYISSAGLRVILSTEKMMKKQGKLIIKHVNETIMEVFEITGFADILTIE